MTMKRVIAAVLAACICLMDIPAEASAPPTELYAQSAVLMDGDSGRVLFEKNGEEQRPMASTTKILTCILVLENAGLAEVACVSAKAAAQPQVRLGVREGEQYQIKDLLLSLMLESHNDAAVILAEHVGKSLEGFAHMMNQKAAEIGCEKYHFVTPNGLDGEDAGGQHSITAGDLAKIMRYCIRLSPKREEFLAVTRTDSHSFTDVEGKRSFSCVNHNAFLGMMEGALSGKTGFTGKAGYCYVGALQRGEKTFIVVLLACGWPNNKTYKWKDTRKLMEYGLENYEYRDVRRDVPLERIPVEGGIPAGGDLGGTAFVQPEIVDGEEIRLLLREDEEAAVRLRMKKGLSAPAAPGQTVGAVEYYLGEALIRRVPVTLRDGADRITLSWCGRKLWKKLMLCKLND